MMNQQQRTSGKTFADFMAAVRESVETHAHRKGYTTGGADDGNQMLAVTKILGINEHHGIAEIIYKAAEYLKAAPATKKILLEKMAGWAFCLWREL